MNKPLVIIAVIVGIVFFVISFIYFTTPAESLPGFFPGHTAGMSTHHYKHGVGALFLGLACFVFAWFQSGNKKSSSAKEEKNG